MAISKIVQNSLSETISLGAKISSVQIANSTYHVKNDTAVNVGGGYIVITGTGFDSNSSVLIGTVSACSVTFVSSTELRAQVPAASAGSYPVYVINDDGGTAIRVNALTYSTEPTWVTTSPLSSQTVDTSFSIQLDATGATSYVLQTGSTLPDGVTLAANGLLSGTVTGVEDETTYNFTVEAIDAENQESPRALSITITGQYQIARSLRIARADGAFLSRTAASNGNRKIWTYSGWIKRSSVNLSDYQQIFGGGTSGSNDGLFFSNNGDSLMYFFDGNTTTLNTTPQFRDPSAWYHVVLAVDTTQATSSNRVKLYVNGVQITDFATTNYPALNADSQYINTTTQNRIGRHTSSGYNFDGYMVEIHFVDGTALTPSSFGRYDNDGIWVPRTVSGVTYGTNGFHLSFSDNTSTTTLGYDSTANENHWTLNNFSVTAGAGNDSFVDTPTNYGDDTGAGGEVRGNYATLNPHHTASTPITFSQGNLQYAGTGAARGFSTISMKSGKWYWEFTCTSTATYNHPGIYADSISPTTDANRIIIRQDGNVYKDGSLVNNIGSFTNGDIIGHAFDADTRELTFYKNGSQIGSAYTATDPGNGNGFYAHILAGSSSGTSGIYNFGQRPFIHTPPSGFKALNTQNLTNTIAKPNTHFGIVTYSGTGSLNTAASNVVTGLDFQPDLVWFKSLNQNRNWAVVDSVRGVRKVLSITLTENEHTDTTGLASFDSGGFTFDGGGYYDFNRSDSNLIAYAWKANGASTITNNNGSIETETSVNLTAGFSIVTYTGSDSSPNTIGHGLNGVPAMWIIKNRSNNTGNWIVNYLDKDVVKYYILNSNANGANQGSPWSTAPTSTVVTLGGNDVNTCNAGENYVGYFWKEIEGYSKLLTWTGNGGTQFLYCGFKPKFALIKRLNVALEYPLITDTKRSPTNPAGVYLLSSAAPQGTQSPLYDYYSNGFRTMTASQNENGSSYVGMFFAEHPLKLTRAR